MWTNKDHKLQIVWDSFWSCVCALARAHEFKEIVSEKNHNLIAYVNDEMELMS